MFEEEINDKEKSTGSSQSWKEYFGLWRRVDRQPSLFLPGPVLSILGDGVPSRWRPYELTHRSQRSLIAISQVLRSINRNYSLYVGFSNWKYPQKRLHTSRSQTWQRSDWCQRTYKIEWFWTVQINWNWRGWIYKWGHLWLRPRTDINSQHVQLQKISAKISIQQK